MCRDDISNYLVHWTKGDSFQEAFETLISIIDESRLIGSTNLIKGEHRCVCFTEAPEDKFHLVSGKYSPFGIKVSKKWLFSQGGRHAIYQRNDEYSQLPEGIRWRHVCYEPDKEPPVDFTWEREWRIQTNQLDLPPEEVAIIVPDSSWIDDIEKHHFNNEMSRIWADVVGYGEWAGIQTPQPFHYHCSPIE